VAAEYQEHFGEHAYDDEGNYIGAAGGGEGQEAWEEYFAEHGDEFAVTGTSEDPASAVDTVVNSTAETSTETEGEELPGETADDPEAGRGERAAG
jgi:hypothetical protein